jgi:hypothetical protein
LIAGPPVPRAAISNALLGQVDLQDNSQAPGHVPSTQPAADLQVLAAQAHLVDGPDLAHALASELRVPVDLALRAPVALRLRARHRARSARHRIAHAAAASSIPRQRKAQ